MKIIIVGLPYFVQKLAAELTEFDKSNQYLPLDVHHLSLDRLRYCFHLMNADIVYSIWGQSYKYNAISLALSLKKKAVMHWVGTDVLTAQKDAAAGRINKSLVNKAFHFTETAWLHDELENIGIDAEVVQFANFKQVTYSTPRKFPSTFSILSYVRQGREKYYGIDKLIQLAGDFPNINIKIAGINKYDSLPANITLLGWINNMDDQYDNCVLFLRIPDHDGLAFSVLEALAHGRYVGYSCKLNNTIFIENYDKLKNSVRDLQDTFINNQLHINQSGINFIRDNYSSDHVLATLVVKLLSLI